MATRSRIGMEMPNGEVRSIYCHWDGYPEGVGATLKEHYTNPEKVEALVALGDISVLGDQLAVSDTVAYHRDCFEDYTPARVDMNIESFAKSDFEAFGYVFTRNGEWIVFQ